MQLKRLFLTVIIINFWTACSIGQEKEMELIGSFLTSLFDEEITPSKIVDNYMPYSKNSHSYSAVISHIEEIRNGRDLDRGWLMPNYKIERLSNFNIGRYLEYAELDVIKPILSELDKKQTFVLLDSERKEILQYFLFENGKIKSFTLFGKGNEFWFFGYD